MGDAGSIPLGFLAAAIGILGNLVNAWPWWFPLLVFSPFIVDATVTLLKRTVSGKKIWVAHREHYYQRLVLLGWSHKKLAIAEYALMLACAASALYALEYASRWSEYTHKIMLLFWCCAYIAIMLGLEIMFARHQSETTAKNQDFK